MPEPIDLIISRLGDPVSVSWPEHTFKCPFCIDRAGSEDWKGHLYVNEERGYFCHRCEARGSTKWLLRTLGITVEEERGAAPEMDLHRIRDIALTIGDEKTHVPKPIGMQPVNLPKNVDYVHANSEVSWYVKHKRKLRDFEIDYYGLLSWVDEHGNSRLLFPDYLDNVLVYWTARAVDDSVKPKYLAAEDSEKSFCVWNLNRVNPDRPIYVAEGIMSARACGSNGTAIYGKFLSDVQLHLLSTRAGSSGVCLVFDSKTLKSSLAAARKFLGRGTPCGIVNLPGDDEDPDSLPKNVLDPLLLNYRTMFMVEDLDRFRLENL